MSIDECGVWCVYVGVVGCVWRGVVSRGGHGGRAGNGRPLKVSKRENDKIWGIFMY